MIRSLRNSGLGQLFLTTVVLAIILTFLFTGQQPGAAAATGNCAVEVGKSCITGKEFQAALKLVTSVGISEKAVVQLRLREQVGRGLAEREVLFEEALRLGLGTSEKDINDELIQGRARISLPADGAERLAANLAMCVDGPRGCAPGTIGIRALSVKQNGEFDYALYERTVRVVSGRSPSHFKDTQMREYTAERVRDLIRSSVRVSVEEAFLAYSRARSKATARTATLETKWFQRYVSSPSETQLKAFEKDHQKEIDEAVKVTADKWADGCAVVSEVRLDSADPGTAEADEVKKTAERLQVLLATGADFDAHARKESQADSAELGGRMGCLDSGYGAGSAVLMEAASALTRPGEVSPVVETIRGMHVLKLVGKVTAENKTDLVRDFVTYKLASEALSREATTKFAEKLISDAKSGVALSDAVEAGVQAALLGGPFEKSESAREHEKAPKSDISRAVTIEQNPVSDSLPEETPTMALFDLVKEDDVHPKPIATRSGLVVLQLKSKDIVTREKFNEERKEILEALNKRKSEQALAAYVEELISKAGGVKLNSDFIPKSEDEAAKGTGS